MARFLLALLVGWSLCALGAKSSLAGKGYCDNLDIGGDLGGCADEACFFESITSAGVHSALVYSQSRHILCRHAGDIDPFQTYELGGALFRLKDYHGSRVAFERVIDDKRVNVEARSNAALSLSTAWLLDSSDPHGSSEAQLKAILRAVVIDPASSEAWDYLATHLYNNRNLADSWFAVTATVALNEYPSGRILHAMSELCRQRGAVLNAISVGQRLLEIDEEYSTSHDIRHKLGLDYGHMGKFSTAREYLQQSVAAEEPLWRESAFMIIVNKREICDWTDFEADDVSLQRMEAYAPSFSALFLPYAPDVLLRIAARDAEKSLIRPRSVAPFSYSISVPSRDGQRLRLGYLSAFLSDHPLGRTVKRTLSSHNRNDVEVHAYSIMDDMDYSGAGVRTYLMASVEFWHDYSGWTAEGVADMINAAGVAVLACLDGHMSPSSLAIMGHHPAPVAIQMQGDPGSTGATYVDYFVTDSMAAPPEFATNFVETLVYMPYCYHITEYVNDMKPPEASEEQVNIYADQLGLPQRHVNEMNEVVFCSFNRLLKMSPALFDLWCRILVAVPNSVLWISYMNPPSETYENLQQEAHSRGVNPSRIVLTGYLAGDHITPKMRCDIYLDIPHHGAHGTAVDVLWTGIPMVAMPGRSHLAGRVSSSMLRSLGTVETLTSSVEEYEKVAVWLASSPEVLRALRDKVERSRLLSPLFKVEQWISAFEHQVRSLWNIYSERAGDFDYGDTWRMHTILAPQKQQMKAS